MRKGDKLLCSPMVTVTNSSAALWVPVANSSGSPMNKATNYSGAVSVMGIVDKYYLTMQKGTSVTTARQTIKETVRILIVTVTKWMTNREYSSRSCCCGRRMDYARTCSRCELCQNDADRGVGCRAGENAC